MAPRSFWKGYLKLSLVTCPVAMTPATSETEKVRFHTLNRATGNRVVSHYVDADTGKPVRGGRRGQGLRSAARTNTSCSRTTSWRPSRWKAPAPSTSTCSFPRQHRLDLVRQAALSRRRTTRWARRLSAVIRDAMDATDTVGISRLVLYRRERAVMLEPRDKGIVLWTLRYGDEVRDERLVSTAPGREGRLRS